jgi:regulation of enolase protein 1 (concanavalin A-like superfamily)
VLAAGAFTVKGSGTDIWSSQDSFQFAHQSLTGDGELIARVGFLDNPGGDPWAKLGVMMRESLAPDSRNVMALLSFGNGNSFQYRASTAGESTSKQAGNRPWIRLTRVANTFTGFSSADGINWIELGSATIEMPATLYVGLAVTSHRSGYLTTGSFANISGFNLPVNPPVSQDIGSANPAGSASLKNGTFTLSGSGLGIWNASDGFQFNHQQLKGDGELIARVAITGNPGGRLSARVGLMMRESLAADSRNVMVFQSGNGNRFQYRTYTGGSTGINGSGNRGWLRLVRKGNVFTGYSSDDGIAWVMLGSKTLTLPETLYFGLAASSHRDGFLTTGTFNNVSGFGSLNNALVGTPPGALLLASAATPSADFAAEKPAAFAPTSKVDVSASYLTDGGPLDLLAEGFGAAAWWPPLNGFNGLDGTVSQTIVADRLTLTFVRTSPDLVYEVLATDDGDSWTVLETNPGKVGAEVTVSDVVPASLNPRRVLKLRVSAP